MNERDWEILEIRTPADEQRIADLPFQVGNRVRLRPGPRGDVFDLALAGRTARVDSIEQDYEGALHLALILDEDPGVAIGPRRPGHRLFFKPAELELIEDGDAPPSAARLRILIAGIGNIFLGDDAFGVEVAQQLLNRRLPDGVRAVDFGIRGFDLAYALVAAPEHTILIDACPQGQAPGTVFVLEPDLGELDQPGEQTSRLDAHDMNPLAVLRLARSMGAELANVTIVGCEPATLGPEEGQLGMSPEVTAAVPGAVGLVESLVARLLAADDSDRHTQPSTP